MYVLPSTGLFHSLPFYYSASFRRLCKGDKNRVRELIIDVATADQRVCEVEKKLHMERDQFRHALLRLNQQIVLLEKQKSDILPN